MITLAILKQMESDGVAGLKVDENAFWEQAPLQSDGEPLEGVWLVTRSGDASNSPKGHNLHSTVDFYVAFNDKTKTEKVQEQILTWIIENPGFCELTGTVGENSYDFENVRIRPSTTPENFVVSQNGLVVKMASATIIYDLKTERSQ